MKLSKATIARIEEALTKVAAKYIGMDGKQPIVTDIHLQPKLGIGELLIFDDEDRELAHIAVPDWEIYEGDDFCADVQDEITPILHKMHSEKAFDCMEILKPFSFVLVDHEKETYADLLLIDDDTILLNDSLLEGLDEELDAFLKELLETN
ncbi:MAG: hypothetical protein IJ511_06000 [Bacteroides sp.]|nr:hypothetical protein [Bacteroides sp.]